MIIEFTGAPCSGKSAVSHRLAELLLADGISVTEKPYVLSHLATKRKRAVIKAANVLRFTFTHPGIALTALKYGPVRWCINYLFIYSCTEKNQVCILEQGLCQCIASLFDGKTASTREIKTYFEALLPEHNDRWQIFIRVKEDKIKNRLFRRSDAVYYETTGNTDSAITQSIMTNKMLYEEWKSRYGLNNCLIISNDEEDGENKAADIIYDELRLGSIV